jgi:hypothetical protein
MMQGIAKLSELVACTFDSNNVNNKYAPNLRSGSLLGLTKRTGQAGNRLNSSTF